jgi:molecular chaperone HtpG
MSTAETRRFEAEVAQVLHLVTHSLYSHKEIFLRELVSNASDACDKLRFEAIANPELTRDDPELRIEVAFDKDARTITVRDNGIGMSRDEVIENVGTIARSGTKKFLEALSGDARKDTALIGQFGVGFYSAFIVADRVTLQTRRADAPAEDAVRWESTGSGEYTIESVSDARRGTAITLHLKEGEDEFLSGWRLRDLISKYSDHVGFPIRMKAEGENAGDTLETVNHASALWTRPKSEITEDDYKNFYKHIAHADGEPLAWTHNRVEGNQSYTSLLYLPSKSPWDAMFSGRDERKGLKLYIRRVFIMDASEQLLPAYLRFVRGVVDSDDLPLNVSREILQENRMVQQMRSGAVKRVLDLLDKLAADDKDKFTRFTNEFGNVLKEGIAEDFGNRERIAKLMRFASTNGTDATKSTSLDDYIARMREGQDAIWYVTADSYAAAKGSPQIEALRARGVEVLLMFDRIDEWMMGYLRDYTGKPLKNATKGDFDLGKLGDSADEARAAQDDEAAKPLIASLTEALGDRVKAVRVSRRLVDSPACLAVEEHDMALHLQRLLKDAGQDVPDARPALEINPAHPLLMRFASEPAGERRQDLALLVLEQAQLAQGVPLDDPSAFIQRMNRVLLAMGPSPAPDAG